MVRRRFLSLVILQGRLFFGAILVAASPVILWPFVILRGPSSIAAWREVQGGLLGRILSDDSYLVHPRVLLERRRLPRPSAPYRIDDAVDPGHSRPLGYNPPQLSNVLTCGITDCQ